MSLPGFYESPEKNELVTDIVWERKVLGAFKADRMQSIILASRASAFIY